MSDFDEHKIELANELRKANAMIASLEEKLDVAADALEMFRDSMPFDSIICDDGETIHKEWATEALNKIRGEKL